MNNEDLQKLKDALEIGRDAAHELAWKFHDEYRGYRKAEHKQVDADVALLEEAMAIAERATQPAQDRCCEHDSDCAVHNAPAYPVGPCDCTLSEKPAQDQVAAVRAVPEGEKWSRIADRLNELDKAIAYSTNLTPSSKPRRLLYAFLNEVCSEPAPSPQPEQSGNSCDSDWFWNLVIAYTKGVGSEGKTLVNQVDAWKEAACAEVETKRQVLSSAYRSATARAEAAEAKLASTRLTDAQIIQRAGEILGFKPHEMEELVKSQYLDFARWAAGEE